MTYDYTWPRVTAIHPDHGSYQMDVHCVRLVEGSLMLIAFQGMPSDRQVAVVRELAEGTGGTIAPLTAADITREMSLQLVGGFRANPHTRVVVVQVTPPDPREEAQS